MTKYFWHRQPIEEHIDMCKFESWFRLKKTRENARNIAYDLLWRHNYMRENAISQLSSALHRITAYQLIAGAVFLTDITVMLSGLVDAEFMKLVFNNGAARIALFSTLFGSGAYVVQTDTRRYLYAQVKDSLEKMVS